MQSVFQDTFKALEAQAKRTPEILVGYSGGKDSRAVIDICRKVFPSVKAFFMYTVPGLSINEEAMSYCKEKWGVEPAMLPDWRTIMDIKDGRWCDVSNVMDGFPDLDLKSAFAYAMDVTGTTIMATGMKDADGLPRRQFFANIRDGADPVWDHVIHPIRKWTKKDVLDYLKVNNIPLPDAEEGAVTSGVGLDHDSLCWLHDKYPDDFKKLLGWFPYAEAAIKRREFYGI
ncbi:MAG: phosphoadenosine phosphosulfate reductase [Verrucomicrobiales bacterium]|nr:phosphoadenosine phosphosulfate reductase [Verrucomicrobiales bacterium]